MAREICAISHDKILVEAAFFHKRVECCAELDIALCIKVYELVQDSEMIFVKTEEKSRAEKEGKDCLQKSGRWMIAQALEKDEEECAVERECEEHVRAKKSTECHRERDQVETQKNTQEIGQ